MSNPLLSIGIIFKNEIRCLARCLKSLQPLREAVSCEVVMEGNWFLPEAPSILLQILRKRRGQYAGDRPAQMGFDGPSSD